MGAKRAGKMCRYGLPYPIGTPFPEDADPRLDESDWLVSLSEDGGVVMNPTIFEDSLQRATPLAICYFHGGLKDRPKDVSIASPFDPFGEACLRCLGEVKAFRSPSEGQIQAIFAPALRMREAEGIPSLEALDGLLASWLIDLYRLGYERSLTNDGEAEAARHFRTLEGAIRGLRVHDVVSDQFAQRLQQHKGVIEAMYEDFMQKSSPLEALYALRHLLGVVEFATLELEARYAAEVDIRGFGSGKPRATQKPDAEGLTDWERRCYLHWSCQVQDQVEGKPAVRRAYGNDRGNLSTLTRPVKKVLQDLEKVVQNRRRALGCTLVSAHIFPI